MTTLLRVTRSCELHTVLSVILKVITSEDSFRRREWRGLRWKASIQASCIKQLLPTSTSNRFPEWLAIPTTL